MKSAIFEIFSIHTIVDSHDEMMIFAISGNICVGTVSLIWHGRVSACFKQLYVSPGFRRRGVATQLIDKCCYFAKLGGCRSIGLSLDSKNLDIFPLYEKNGFQFSYQYDDGSHLLTRQIQQPESGVSG